MTRAWLVFPLLALLAPGCARKADDAPARLVRLQQACERAARADDDLLAAPGGPDEAAGALRTLDRLAAAEGEWDAFRAWVRAGRGTPETVAGLDRAWAEYGAALAALRSQLEKWTRADPSADQPGLDAKRSEDYVTLHNRLAAACEGLADWAARASPADFTSAAAAAGPAPARDLSSPAP